MDATNLIEPSTAAPAAPPGVIVNGGVNDMAANPAQNGTAGATAVGGKTMFAWAKNINWLEMGFMVLGSAALFTWIYYSRYKLKEDRVVNSDLQKQIDEIKRNMPTKKAA